MEQRTVVLFKVFFFFSLFFPLEITSQNQDLVGSQTEMIEL